MLDKFAKAKTALQDLRDYAKYRYIRKNRLMLQFQLVCAIVGFEIEAEAEPKTFYDSHDLWLIFADCYALQLAISKIGTSYAIKRTKSGQLAINFGLFANRFSKFIGAL